MRWLLVILDCCFAGGIPITKDIKGLVKSNPPRDFLDRLSKGGGKVIIASSQEYELSWTGTPYSAFTNCLIDAFSGRGTIYYDGYAKIFEILSYLFREVPRATNYKQHPLLNSINNLSEDFAVCYYAGGLKSIPDGSHPNDNSTSPSVTSSKLFRLKEKLEDLEANRKLLRLKTNRYRDEIAIESDLTQKIKLETKFVETKADLEAVESEMDEIEKQIAKKE